MKEKKQTSYRPKKRFGSILIPLLTLTMLTAVVSLVLAGVWQLMDPVEYIPPDIVPWKQSTKGTTAPKESGTGSSQSVPEPTAEPTPEPTPEPAAPAWEARVQKGEWAPSEYFNDALFVGDSITEGIKIYDVMSNAKVLSFTGINLDNIFTKPVIKTTGEEKITIIDAAKAESPGKIYVMMGANSMLADKETFIKGYGRLVDTLSQMHPDAIIYVQSILPVTETYAKNRPDFNNKKIDEYNAALEQMAAEKQMYYLDVAEDFKNEQGALPTEASPKDGMHFSADWYRKWFDYLRNHTVPAK
ncbi:MAG: GDSL-type esterase/lipase family protein [Angelakisella sp.]